MPLQFLVQLNQSEASLLEQAILVLQRIGFFQIIIPFILFFAVIFAILEKSKILGENVRSINAIVALVIALTATAAVVVTGIVSTMIPLVMLSIIVLLLFFQVYGLFAGDLSKIGPGIRISFGIASGVAVAVIFLYSANLFKYVTGEIIGMVLLIAAVIAVIATIVAASRSSKD